MKWIVTYVALVFMTVPAVDAGSKPIEYVVTDKASIMTISMNGAVEWTEALSGTTMKIVITGGAKNFIVKRINYQFKDGVIKAFSMAPSHPDTEQVHITLRKSQAYRIYQNPASKKLNIEFPSSSAAVPVYKAAAEPARPAKNAPINIAKIAVDQVQEPVQSVTAATVAEKSSTAPLKNGQTLESVNASALLLLFVSTLIIIGGGIILAYVIIKKKNIDTPAASPAARVPDNRQSVEIPSDAQPAALSEIEADTSAGYAEQYLRSQGEFELQQRLEHLHALSFHSKIERAVAKRSSKRADHAADAQKLGISIGELELASRLRTLQDQRTTESV